VARKTLQQTEEIARKIPGADLPDAGDSSADSG